MLLQARNAGEDQLTVNEQKTSETGNRKRKHQNENKLNESFHRFLLSDFLHETVHPLAHLTPSYHRQFHLW